MRRDHIEMVALVPASPQEVYAVLADYAHEHVHIVPTKYLRNLEVEQGGFGAGTIIRYRARAFGIERPSRAIISEPEAGRVLVEQETTTGLKTTFTVTPTAQPDQTHLQITVRWVPSSNPFTMVEQALYPYIMRDMLTQSFQLVAQYTAERRKREASSPSTTAE